MTKIDDAARLLLQARATGERLTHWPSALQLHSQAQAEAVCEAMARGLEQPIGGWKIGAMNPETPIKQGLVRPFCGQIPRALIFQSGAAVQWSALQRPVVEAEIVLRLGKDLPPSATPYEYDDVRDAIDCAMAAIEIPESRLVDGHSLGALGMVADQGYAGRLVVGAASLGWKEADLSEEQVSLCINDKPVASGSGARAMGHPLRALQWLANYRSALGDGLRRGQVVSTGSLTGIHYTHAGDEVEARFSSLGSVTLRLR